MFKSVGTLHIKMKERTEALLPGLYMVATPIGSARDITLRALDVFRLADVIVAEDTRITRRLFSIHGIVLRGRRMISYNDHNGAKQRPGIIRNLTDGCSVCFVSDAGTPLIADPGYKLVNAAAEAGIDVFAVPGASAVTSALMVAGLPTDQFMFAGFLPFRLNKLHRMVAECASSQATTVYFETARRLPRSLRAMAEELGPERRAAVCRELTKKFEEVWRGTLGELAERAENITPLGECVILVDRAERGTAAESVFENDLKQALERTTLKAAVSEIAKLHNVPRRLVYQRAITMSK